jgi:hypothetical protein
MGGVRRLPAEVAWRAGGPSLPPARGGHARLFLRLAALAGLAYWALTDWMVYVECPDGTRFPKSELPLPAQLAISGVVGALAAAPTAILALGARLAWSRLKWRAAATTARRTSP